MTHVLEVTSLYCGATGLEPGEDGATHHLAPRGPASVRRMVCTHCGASEASIRTNLAHPPVPGARDSEGTPAWYSCPMCGSEVTRLEGGDTGPTDLFACDNCDWGWEA